VSGQRSIIFVKTTPFSANPKFSRRQNLEQFEVILWVAADNDTTIGESFWAIADGLGQLGSEDEAKDAVAAAGAVKKFLAMTSTSTKRFPTCLIPVHLTALL